MNPINKFLTLAGLLLGATSLSAIDVVVPRVINSSTTWTADNVYFLEGYTFVVTPSGATGPTVLTIEPGTVIKGRLSTGANAASLIITRGSKIHADGTSTNPIIFTSELDDFNGNLGPDDSTLWGGVIVLGYARTNSRSDGQIVSAPVEDQIEGVEVTGDELEWATFGGTDDEDDSGVIRYISIRHGGAVVGGDNEINGLTLGGVGSKTVIEYVEIFANKDDGIEWFGGTVDVRYAVVAFGTDDSFDYDQGWRGRGQFFVAIGKDSGDDRMDKGGEHDGSTAPLDAEPVGGGVFYNVTYIGIGDTLQPDGTPARGNTALNIRDNAISKYYNSVFLDFARMLDIENDNKIRFDAGDVDFRNNVWWSHVTANNSAAGLNARPDGVVDSTIFWTDAARNNLIADPMLWGVSREADGGFDPRPMPGSPALVGPFATVPDDGFFVQTNFKGAFSPDHNWMIGWTKLSTEGYLSSNPSYVFTEEFGWVWAFSGSVAPGNWVWVIALDNLAYIGSSDPTGSWVYIMN